MIAKYMQGYKQFGWKAALTKMYTVSQKQSRSSRSREYVGGRIATRGCFLVSVQEEARALTDGVLDDFHPYHVVSGAHVALDSTLPP